MIWGVKPFIDNEMYLLKFGKYLKFDKDFMCQNDLLLNF